MQAPVRYNNVAITLHWIIAVLVLVLIGLGLYMTDIPRNTEERSFFYNLHKSIGVTTAIIVLIRVWWRLKNPPPPLPAPTAPGALPPHHCGAAGVPGTASRRNERVAGPGERVRSIDTSCGGHIVAKTPGSAKRLRTLGRGFLPWSWSRTREAVRTLRSPVSRKVCGSAWPS